MITRTVGQLRKALKNLPANMPIYVSDHDHGTYETNGPLHVAEVKDQAEAEPWRPIEKDFEIEGPYLNLRL